MAANLFSKTASFGGANTTGFITIPGGAAPPAGVVYDSADRYETALANSPPLVSYPFSKYGDTTSKVVRVRVEQRLKYRVPLLIGTKNLDAPHANCLLFDEGEPDDKGADIGQWWRSYANVPPKITVPGDFVYKYQYLLTSGSTLTLGEFARKTACITEYDYYLYSDQDKFPILYAPRAVQLGTGPILVQDGGASYRLNESGLGVYISDDDRTVAEDSSYEIYHFPIMVRKTIYVPGPKVAYFGAATGM